MKILIVGGTGFIGSHLKAKLEELGHDVWVTYSTPRRVFIPKSLHYTNSVDWWQTRVTNEFLHQIFSFDRIYFMGSSPKIPGLDYHDFRDETFAFVTFLSYIRPNCDFIYTSSAVVYGPHHLDLPHDENDACMPKHMYGAIRLANETQLRIVAATRGFHYHILRPVATISGTREKGLIADIIRKLRSDSPTLNLFGDKPGSRKPYIHVDDVVDAHVNFEQFGGGITNISTVTTLSVEEVAHICMHELGVNKDIMWDASKNWPEDDKYIAVDSSSARYDGWHCGTSEKAIRKTIGEYKELHHV